MSLHALLLCAAIAVLRASPMAAQEAAHAVIQEKVYLHLDNNNYHIGDTIWYKAYVVMADDHSPNPLSRILYTELLNEQGYLVERQQLVVDEHGQAQGQFALQGQLYAGYYEIRAYTKWMLNFGYSGDPHPRGFRFASVDDSNRLFRKYEHLFSRVIPVYDKPDTPQQYTLKTMTPKVSLGPFDIVWTTPRLSVAFYPEGGHLLRGHRCLVAWEACNQQLQRQDISALIIDDAGHVVDSVATTYSGRGTFFITPQAGQRYRLQTTIDGTIYTFPLPPALDEGVNLHMQQADDAVAINIGQRFATTHPRLTLGIYCRGRQLTSQPLGNEPTATHIISTDDLTEGVNQVVVHDAEGRVYADRLFFINKSYESKAHITIARAPATRLTPHQRVTLNLLLTDAKGRPAAGETFSVAVRDSSQLSPTYATGNILTYMLLESDLRGFIDNPHYYFQSDDSAHRAALDLLMLVQGWRRYDWNTASDPRHTQLDYLPERKMMIYGRAIPLRTALFTGKDLGAIQVSCYLNNTLDTTLRVGDYNRFEGVAVADSDGRFQFEYQPFYGSATLIMRAKFVDLLKKKKKYDIKTYDNRIFVWKQHFYPMMLKQYAWYETNTPPLILPSEEDPSGRSGLLPLGAIAELEQLGSEATNGAGERLSIVNTPNGVELPSVVIVGRNNFNRYARPQRDKVVATIDALHFINTMWDMGYYNTQHLLDNNDFDISEFMTLMQQYISMNYRPYHGEHHTTTFDWDDTNVAMLAQRYSFLPALGKVEIVSDSPRRPVPYQVRHKYRYIHRSMGVADSLAFDAHINIVTLPTGSTRFLRGREYTFPGFNRPAQFYNPDYSHTPLPPLHDHRHTLYWNPTVTTDRYGQATITFYNNASCNALHVSAEGLTRYGQYIVSDP